MDKNVESSQTIPLRGRAEIMNLFLSKRNY